MAVMGDFLGKHEPDHTPIFAIVEPTTDPVIYDQLVRTASPTDMPHL